MSAASAARPSRFYWALAALYLLAFPYHPGLRSPNELCRLWQTRAIVEYGTLTLNQTIREFGYVGDLSRMGPWLYPSKAPLLSFAALPIYKVLSILGGGHRYAVPELALVFFSRLFLTVLPTLGMLVLLRRFLRAYVSAPIADAVVITYAAGTLAFSYSLLFMSHQTCAVLLFAAFFALWRCARGEWRERGYLVAGAAAGAAVASEYTGAMAVLALALYTAVALLARPELPWRTRGLQLARAAGLVLLGALPFLAGLMAYHTVCFGGPLESGYKHLNDVAYQPWHLGGFLGIRTPDPRAFALSFFSPLRGLFALSPVLLVAIPGTRSLKLRGTAAKDRALFVLTVALWLGYAYFTSSFTYESWGWTTGPRHMTGLVPFLLLPIALELEQARERARAWVTGAIAGLAAASIVITGALSLVNYVPDSVTNAFFGFAVPIFAAGFLPPSVLGLWVPNPASGLVVLALLAVCAAAPVALLMLQAGSRSRARIAGVAAAAVALVLGVLAVLPRNPDADAGAQKHLESVWLQPDGHTFSFWPSLKG